MLTKIMGTRLGTWIAIIVFANSVVSGFLYRCSLNTHTEDLFWPTSAGFATLSLIAIYISCLVMEEARRPTKMPVLQGNDRKIFIAISVFIFVTLFLIGSSVMAFTLRKIPGSPTHLLTMVILMYLLVNLTIIIPRGIMNYRSGRILHK